MMPSRRMLPDNRIKGLNKTPELGLPNVVEQRNRLEETIIPKHTGIVLQAPVLFSSSQNHKGV
jgi:hypothetical protein